MLVQLSINDDNKLFHWGYRDIYNRKGNKEITRMVIRMMTKTANVASACKVKVVFSSIGVSVSSGIGSSITSG